MMVKASPHTSTVVTVDGLKSLERTAPDGFRITEADARSLYYALKDMYAADVKK